MYLKQTISLFKWQDVFVGTLSHCNRKGEKAVKGKDYELGYELRLPEAQSRKSR